MDTGIGPGGRKALRPLLSAGEGRTGKVEERDFGTKLVWRLVTVRGHTLPVLELYHWYSGAFAFTFCRSHKVTYGYR